MKPRLGRYIVRQGNPEDQRVLRFRERNNSISREVDESGRLVVWHKPLSPEQLNELDTASLEVLKATVEQVVRKRQGP